MQVEMFGKTAAKGSSSQVRVAIDLMGADVPPETLIQGVLEVAEQLPAKDSLHVIAPEAIVSQFSSEGFVWHVAEEEVTMDDPPIHALRHKRSSSMHKGIELVKRREVDAFVSCGNTGVLFGLAALKLTRKAGVIRPALIATVPTQKGRMQVLDVGGNVDYKPEHLCQFAEMGVAEQRRLGVLRPKVALLNIGSESKKGPLPLREAHHRLTEMAEEAEWSFVGNIEGKEVFKGGVDVLVTDGFTGNVFLKTAEGVSSAILDSLPGCPEELKASVKKQFCNDSYSGALICGVQGVVVKCHGHPTAAAFAQAIRKAILSSQ